MNTTINWEALDKIEGWLNPDAAILVQRAASEMPGAGVLELGVFRGKLLALAASLFPGPVVGVDAMWNGMNNPLTGDDLESAKAKVHANVDSVAPWAKVQLIVEDTTTLKPSDIAASQHGYAFVSVDAGHDPDPVEHDLDLAAHLLARGGVIFLDDAFNSACPGVGEGFFRFLNKDDRLRAFATGHNKTLLTDKDSHGKWLARAYNWAATGTEPIFERTRNQIAANTAAFWTPTLYGSEIVPFI